MYSENFGTLEYIGPGRDGRSGLSEAWRANRNGRCVIGERGGAGTSVDTIVATDLTDLDCSLKLVNGLRGRDRPDVSARAGVSALAGDWEAYDFLNDAELSVLNEDDRSSGSYGSRLVMTFSKIEDWTSRLLFGFDLLVK